MAQKSTTKGQCIEPKALMCDVTASILPTSTQRKKTASVNHISQELPCMVMLQFNWVILWYWCSVVLSFILFHGHLADVDSVGSGITHAALDDFVWRRNSTATSWLWLSAFTLHSASQFQAGRFAEIHSCATRFFQINSWQKTTQQTKSLDSHFFQH